MKDNAIKIENFERKTANEWGEAFVLIDLVPGSTAYRFVDNGRGWVYYIGYVNNCEGDDYWVCEIDSDGGTEACFDGETPQHALENAIAETQAPICMREYDNCEDAVNAIAYESYAILSGSYEPPFTGAEVEILNRLMATATEWVKKDGPLYGIEWEPYQVCEFED